MARLAILVVSALSLLQHCGGAAAAVIPQAAIPANQVHALVPEPSGAAIAALLMVVVAGVSLRTRRD
jgi:hypothetical protein